MKVALVTLGCDKNTVDSERYLAELSAHGASATTSIEEAEIVIVNTCGFIDAAKRESLDAIVEVGRLKRDGACRALVAIGCMVERHRDEMRAALPEVDILLGTSDADRLIEELHACGLVASEILAHPGVRRFNGELPHVRYLKVSEGCDHGCAFCAIPLMRGRHRSFPAMHLAREAQLLEAQGARELNLVAQDLAHYGRDVRDGTGLPELLELLLRETDIPWIRMLYLYSQGITRRLLEVVSREPRVLPYLDMPIQHASDPVLARMRRPERRRTISAKIAQYREAVPDVVIRTTCIVGFPGETDADFEILLEFIEETGFDRVGAFTYSAQNGTRAAQLADDVPETLKRERLERLNEAQRGISAERAERRLGTRTRVIVDRDGTSCEARAWWQASDVDGITHLDRPERPGSFVDVTLQSVMDDHDLQALVAGPSETVARRMAALPLLTAPVMSSYGR
jgi:ribosomal protein S12 methylthiotransferase